MKKGRESSDATPMDHCITNRVRENKCRTLCMTFRD